jgi:phage-related minor tail protein
MRDEIHVLTAIVLRHEDALGRLEETVRATLTQMTAMVAQHRRFSDRLRRLEKQPAQ